MTPENDRHPDPSEETPRDDGGSTWEDTLQELLARVVRDPEWFKLFLTALGTVAAVVGSVATSQPYFLFIAAPGVLALVGVAVLRWLERRKRQELPPDPKPPDSHDDAVGRLRSSLQTVRPPVDPPLLDQLAGLCGRRPEVLEQAASSMQTQVRAEELVRRLERATEVPPYRRDRGLVHNLDQLARKDHAYRRLSPRAARLFRVMALAPLSEMPDPAAQSRDEILVIGTADPLPDDALAAAGFSPEEVEAAEDELSESKLLGPPVGADKKQIKPQFGALARLHLLRDETSWRRRRAYVRILRHLASEAEGRGQPPDVDESERLEGTKANNEWFRQNHVLLHRLVANPSAGPRGELLPRRARRWWFRMAMALCTWYAERPEDRRDWHEVVEAVARVRRRHLQVLPFGWGEKVWIEDELGVIARRSGRLLEAENHLREAEKALRWWRLKGAGQVSTNLAHVKIDQAARHRARVNQLQIGQVKWRLQEARTDLDKAKALLRRAASLRSRRDATGQGLTAHTFGIMYLELAEQAHLFRLLPEDQRPEARGGGPGTDPGKPLYQEDDRALFLEEASQHLEEAARAFSTDGETRGLAMTFLNQILAYGRQERTALANECATSARACFAELSEAGRDASDEALIDHHLKQVGLAPQADRQDG